MPSGGREADGLRAQIKCLPGMTADKAKAVTDEAHNNGLALVGIWMFELAEAFSDVLRSAGLKSDIESE